MIRTINAIKYIYHKLSHFFDFKVKLLSAKIEATSVFVLLIPLQNLTIHTKFASFVGKCMHAIYRIGGPY